MNNNNNSTMLVAANEKGNILLDLALILGIIAIGAYALTKVFGLWDKSSCGIMENCQ